MYVSMGVAFIGIKHCSVLLLFKTEVGVGGYHPSCVTASASLPLLCPCMYHVLQEARYNRVPLRPLVHLTEGYCWPPDYPSEQRGGRKKQDPRPPTTSSIPISQQPKTSENYWVIIHMHAERTFQSLKLSKFCHGHIATSKHYENKTPRNTELHPSIPLVQPPQKITIIW